jgi:hypothetical protein
LQVVEKHPLLHRREAIGIVGWHCRPDSKCFNPIKSLECEFLISVLLRFGGKEGSSSN